MLIRHFFTSALAMRKSANKQLQVQTIQKTIAGRNVTQVNGYINSGKAVTDFVVIAWEPTIFIKKHLLGNLHLCPIVLTQSSPNRMK